MIYTAFNHDFSKFAENWAGRAATTPAPHLGSAPPIHVHVTGADAGSEPPTRRGVELHAAMMLLMELPTPALEVLRDEFERMANERTGPRGELKRAWWKFTRQVIDDAKLRKGRGEFALYDDLKPGRDYDTH